MERYTMFLEWKNKYCNDDCAIQVIYRFSAIPIKLTMVFFTELKQKIQSLYANTKGLNSQSNLKKVKQSWRNKAP